MTNLRKNLSQGQPLVSIGIPVYNGADYIEEAIKSVIEQSIESFELIICDNGSTDDTSTVLSNLDDERITVIRFPENRGMAASWNECLRNCSAEYFLLLPHDDLLVKNSLEEKMSMLAYHPSAPFAFAGRKIIDSEGRTVLERHPPFKEGPVARWRLIAACFLSGMNQIGDPASVLCRSSVFKKHQVLYEDSLPWVIDLRFFLKLSKYGSPVYGKKALSKFRIQSNSTSVLIANDQAKQFVKFFQDLEDKPAMLSILQPVLYLSAYFSQFLRSLIYRYIKSTSRGRT